MLSLSHRNRPERSGLAKASLVLALALSAPRARAAPDGLAPPDEFVDRSGLTELVFWQGVNGLLAGSVLGYAATAGQLDAHCRTTYGSDQHHSQACKDALGRGAGITIVGLAAGIGLPLLLTRGREVKTADALLVNRSTLIGAMHGYIIPFAAGLEPFNTKKIDYVVDVDESRWLAGATFAGDVVGAGVGTFLANRYDPTPGTVSFLGTLHSVPLGAKVHVNGALCGESPCVYHTRYGFPDRIHVQLDKDGYQSADFYLDTEAPQISYLLLGFGSYLFHTFAQEYRFRLKPQAGALPADAANSSPTPSPAPDPAPIPPARPSAPDAPTEPSPDAPPPPPPAAAEPSWT
jgi:hypothetical protein